MSAEDRAALQRLAETVEDRSAEYLRKWLALPEFRAALHEHARFMRETVREEMRAEREANRDVLRAVNVKPD